MSLTIVKAILFRLFQKYGQAMAEEVIQYILQLLGDQAEGVIKRLTLKGETPPAVGAEPTALDDADEAIVNEVVAKCCD